MDHTDLPPILDLDDITEGDQPRTGAKAFHLALMRQSSLPVPDGFVVCADAVDPQQPVFSPALHKAVAQAYAALGQDVAVAVRSSAIGEDGAVASFAGQFLSRMPVVGLEALLEAISACWASRISAMSAAYARLRGQQPPPRPLPELKGLPPEARLTPLEHAIIQHDLAGIPRREISHKLGITPGTITVYRRLIRQKLYHLPQENRSAAIISWLRRFPGRQNSAEQQHEQ